MYTLEKKKRDENEEWIEIEKEVEQYSPQLLEKYSLKENDHGKM